MGVRAAKALIHVAVAFCAYAFAYQLVLAPTAYWWLTAHGRPVLLVAGIYALIAAAVELALRAERAAWRFVSVHDVINLARSAGATAVIFLVAAFILVRADSVPRSVMILAPALHLAGLAGVRLMRRLVHERSVVRAFAPMLHRAPRDAAPLLLVGDLAEADAFLRELARDVRPRYDPVGILGMETAQVGQRVRGVEVLGLAPELESMLGHLKPGGRAISAVLFLTPPDLLPALPPQALGRMKAAGLSLLRLPVMRDLSAAHGTLPGALRELSLEELLARSPVRLNEERIHGLVNGKRILVTGAGGSIGSEICRQVAAFGCARLVMLDQSEFGLFALDQEMARAHPALERREMICDVRDAARVTACIGAEAPDIIFHAAALKHVPLVENHPCEGVLTNVVGTWNVAQAARAAGVGQMVLISTDKAVDPCNMMGATKRLAEAVVRGGRGRSRTAFGVVRFGNVLGSTGSVVPTFQAQIARGGPVTVTHPEVERYFMTIPEAVQLVLHATAEGAARDLPRSSVFVLDMGDPVKIADLARSMIVLQGLEVGRDIEIAYTGLRPGEKLSEALIDDNERVLTLHPSVFEVVERRPASPLAARQVRELEALARSGQEAAIREAVGALVARLRGRPRAPRALPAVG